jgi:hypothetical protein
MDREQLRQIEDGVHAFLHAQVDRAYGHLYCSVSLDTPETRYSYSRNLGRLKLTSQIGCDYESGVRAQMKDPNAKVYAIRVEHECHEGISTHRLKALTKYVGRYEDLQEQDRGAGYAHQALHLMQACKVRWVLVRPQPISYSSGPSAGEDLLVLDLKKPSHIIEVRDTLDRWRDQVWDRVVSRQLRQQIQDQLRAEGESWPVAA